MAELLGMRTVMDNLNRELLKIKARSMKGLIESAIIIRRDMEKTPPLIPLDTGNLRASIVKALDKPRLTEKVFTSAEKLKDVTDVSYGYYIEFGTRYFKPSPFMRQALNDNIDKIEKIFISEEKKAISK